MILLDLNDSVESNGTKIFLSFNLSLRLSYDKVSQVYPALLLAGFYLACWELNPLFEGSFSRMNSPAILLLEGGKQDAWTE